MGADEESTPREALHLPFRVDEVGWEEWSEGVRFGGRIQRLGERAGATQVGVLIEELPPHRQSAPLHWHTCEEEHLWFLDGRATLRLGDERHPVAAGDYVCFPAGRPVGHCIVNDSDAPCRYLVIGQRSPNDVCIYPDSAKMLISAAGGMILSTEAVRGYWDGEKADEVPT
jgi:uncharacterized cupin superfamily protein